jgi:hypothetical protein
VGHKTGAKTDGCITHTVASESHQCAAILPQGVAPAARKSADDEAPAG